MKKTMSSVIVVVIISVFLSAPGFSAAAEHPGMEMEQPKKTMEKPKKAEHPGEEIDAKFVKKSIKDHVKAQSKEGIFTIHDEKLNKEWKLKLDKIHDPVRKFEKDGQTIYFTCSDFKSIDSNDVLDIDFWMIQKGDKLEVIDTKIHKLNGEPRYNYEGLEIKEIK